MPTFSVSLWAVFEADNWEDAYKKADQIEMVLLHNDEVEVEDTGIINVECSDEEYVEEEE
jgi:hypothetical protein